MEGKEKCSRRRKRTSVAAGIFLIAIALFIAVAPITAQPVEVRVNAPEYVEEGETFVVTIDVDSVSDLNSAQFDLYFDPDVVEVSEVKEGEINGEDFTTFRHQFIAEDTVRVLAIMQVGEVVSGSGYLAEIEFEVEGEKGEKSELKFSYGELNGLKEKVGTEHLELVDIPANWINVTITIGVEGEGEEEDDGDKPKIIACEPLEADVSSTEGEPMTFKITVDTTVDISWQINGTEVQMDEDVTEAASYTNTSVIIGTWNVSAIATNRENDLSIMHTWIWNIAPTSTEEPGATSTPTPTLAPGETPAPTPTLAPGETAKPTTKPALPKPTAKPTAPPTGEEKPTPEAEEPGFEAVFAIAVILGIAYILLRRKR